MLQIFLSQWNWGIGTKTPYNITASIKVRTVAVPVAHNKTNEGLGFTLCVSACPRSWWPFSLVIH